MYDTLQRYQPFMDTWIDHIDMSQFDKTFKGRSNTLRYVFEQMAARCTERIRIVELGTSRSFVDGRFEGCNSNDTKYWDSENPEKWDFGAGCFTYLAAEFFARNYPNFELHTVDLESSHIQRCKHMTRPFSNHIIYHVQSSLDFLRTFKTKCDILYMDTGDMTPIESTAQLQLSEAKLIVAEKLVNPNGYVLIDDVRNPTALRQQPHNFMGKAKYSIPFLLQNQLKIVKDEYQVVMSYSGI